MKRTILLMLQVLAILVGCAILVALISLPLTEGRAAHLDPSEIYTDPFVLYGYLTSMPFFLGLYRVYGILGLIRQNAGLSLRNLRALKQLTHCCVVFGGMVLAAGGYILVSHHPADDPAGFLALCTFTSFLSFLTGTAAWWYKRQVKQILGPNIRS